MVYWYLITNYADPDALFHVIWSFKARIEYLTRGVVWRLLAETAGADHLGCETFNRENAS